MERMMDAIVKPVAGEGLELRRVPVPTPGPGEVLIKVHTTAICGTDVHIFHGDEGAAKTPAGTVLGHEFAGEIVEVGAGVKHLKAGDRVCVDPNQLCGACEYCLGGIGHFCEHMTGIGTTVHGGVAEYCVVAASQAYRFSDSVFYDAAAMTEPVSCCLHGIDLCEIQCGSTVAVIGCGMIGSLVAEMLKIYDLEVLAFDPFMSPEKAEKLGVTPCSLEEIFSTCSVVSV